MISLMALFFVSFFSVFVVVVIIISERKLYLVLKKEILSCWEFTREGFKDRDEISKFLLLCIFTTDLMHLWDIFQ